MELGKRIREVRLALGLSQRQLCGDEITRNMLSQIENGGARPSMDTLKYLAGKLGKPVSFFLEEETVTSPNQDVMGRVREAYRMGDWRLTLAMLEDYRGRDPLFDEEAGLLQMTALLGVAEHALAEGRRPYAQALLEQAGEIKTMYAPLVERRRRVLAARITGDPAELPSLDEELFLRAEAADPERVAALLDAAEDQDSSKWNLLRGKAYLALGEFQKASQCLHKAEETYPQETASLLETCYRELEDFKMAYFYACKQR